MRDTDTGLVETDSLKEEPQEKMKVVFLVLVDTETKFADKDLTL